MKNRVYYFVFVGCIAFQGCARKPVIIKDAAWKQRCEGVTSLAWQNEVQGADAATSAKIISDLTLKAQADAKKSEDLKGSAALDGSLKSEFARAINENVSASSKVDDEFWRQENTFSRLYCLSVSLLDRPDLSKEQKVKIVDDIRDMQKSEAVYTLNKEKKSGNNPR